MTPSTKRKRNLSFFRRKSKLFAAGVMSRHARRHAHARLTFARTAGVEEGRHFVGGESAIIDRGLINFAIEAPVIEN